MNSLLIDTNIWVDDCFDMRPKHTQAMKLLLKANEHDVELLYAPHSSKDVFRLVKAGVKNVLRKINGNLTEADALAAHQFAWSYLDYMSEVATAVGCDNFDIHLAKKQRKLHGEYEDDLLIAAVLRSKANLLVTNDEKLLHHCPVPALNCEDAITYLDTLDN